MKEFFKFLCDLVQPPDGQNNRPNVQISQTEYAAIVFHVIGRNAVRFVLHSDGTWEARW